jgi:hypothetical protein
MVSKLELFLWEHGVVGADKALTDDELVELLTRHDRRVDWPPVLRAGARTEFRGLHRRGLTRALKAKIAGRYIAPRRVWYIPDDAARPDAELLRLEKRRERQRRYTRRRWATDPEYRAKVNGQPRRGKR